MLYGKTINDTTSGFRAINKQLIEKFAASYPVDYPEPETNASSLREGLRIVEVPVKMRERGAGVSSIRLWGSVWYMIKVSLAILIDYFRRTRG